MNNSTTRTPSRPGQAGFTLLEAVIAMALLSFGILGVCMMQGRALRAGAAAFNRTEAQNVALTLVEALQQLPSDDPMLKATGTTDDPFPSSIEDGDDDNYTRKVQWVGGNARDNDKTGDKRGKLPTMWRVMVDSRDDSSVAHRCQKKGAGLCGSDSGGTTKLETLLEPAFKVLNQDDKVIDARGRNIGGVGMVRDRTGTIFDLAWAVQDVMVDGVKVNGIDTATDKRIRVYVEWDTPMGIKNHLEYTINKFASDIND